MSYVNDIMNLAQSPEVFYTRKYGTEGKVSLQRTPVVPQVPNPAVLESIRRCFECQRGSEMIYSSNYGVDWEQFIGRRLNVELVAAIQKEVRDAMLCHPFVKDCATHVARSSYDSIVVMCAIEVKDQYCLDAAEVFGLVHIIENSKK